jgi:poly-gamma-glutamate synthesis protein (capsule biosynthesis protein)
MTCSSEQFTIVKAENLIQGLPSDLPALLIAQSPKDGPRVRVCAVGDISLSGRAAVTAHHYGPDPLFAELASILQAADITFGNLESPLAGEIARPGSMFAAPAEGATILRQAGFNVAHLANNHVGEYGQAGLAATLGAIRESGILPLGAGDNPAAARQLIRTDVNNFRIGWLGSGRTLLRQNETGPQYWEFNEGELLDAVAHARSNVDLLIVSIHIGFMYMDYPRPQHKVVAERLMGCGADLVLMHHAHVLQGVQTTPNGRICCYNLGNFLYDWQEGNVQTPVVLRQQNEGAAFWFELDGQGIALAAALPTWIDEKCCVRWATGDRGREILNRLVRISKDLEGDVELLFERQRAERNMGPIIKVLAFHIRHRNWRDLLESVRRARFEHIKMLIRWFMGTCRPISWIF